MRREGIAILFILLAATSFLSGCEEKTNSEGSNPNNISFDGGGIFKLVSGSLKFNTNNSGAVVSAEVTMLFQNIADRTVSAEVTVTFYDANNTAVNSTQKYFYDYPAGYTDYDISPANIVVYDGEDAYRVDHVSITVREIT